MRAAVAIAATLLLAALVLADGLVLVNGGRRRRAPTAAGGASMPAGAVMWHQFNNSNEWAAGSFSDKSGNGNTNAQADVAKRGAWMNPGVRGNGTTTIFNFKTNAVPLSEFTLVSWWSNATPKAEVKTLFGWYTVASPYDQCELNHSKGSANGQTNVQCTLYWKTVVQATPVAAYSNSNTLHFLAFTFATNNANLYIDGILKATDTSCSYIATNRTGWGATEFCWSPGFQHSDATVYENIIWHRALSSNEIWTTYSIGALSP
jgi:hypothetical protein